MTKCFAKNFWKLTKMNHISSIIQWKLFITFDTFYLCLIISFIILTDRIIFEEDRTRFVLDQGEETGHREDHGEGHEHHQHQPRVQRPTHADNREYWWGEFVFVISKSNKWMFDATGSESGIATNVISACLDPVSGLLSEVDWSAGTGGGRGIITSLIRHSMWGRRPS